MPATAADAEKLALELEVLNAVTAPGKHPVMKLRIGKG